MVNEKSLENLDTRPFSADNPERARAAQKKSVESRLNAKYFRELAMKQFHKGGRDKETFSALSDKAAGGDVAAAEQIRKWIDKEGDEKATGTTINLVIGSQEEKVALDKWSK